MQEIYEIRDGNGVVLIETYDFERAIKYFMEYELSEHESIKLLKITEQVVNTRTTGKKVDE